MEFIFTLVEPAVAENVGASARALKTMGFGRLVLVNSQVHRQPGARWLAHGSADILESIEVFPTLGEAVKDADLVIGTTAKKKRRVHTDYYLCSEIPDLLDSKSGMLEKVVLVFGREESGLTNNELKLCNILSTIPMKNRYPSLNLAQSVMIYAWELFRYNIITSKSTYYSSDAALLEPGAKKPATEKYSHLRTMASEVLQTLGYEKQSAIYPRIMERMEAMGDKDAGLLLSVCSRLKKVLDGRNHRE